MLQAVSTTELWAEAQPGDFIVDPPEELLTIEQVFTARAILTAQLRNLQRSEPARFTPWWQVWALEVATLEQQICDVTAELPDAEWLAVYRLQ